MRKNLICELFENKNVKMKTYIFVNYLKLFVVVVIVVCVYKEISKLWYPIHQDR